MDRPAVYRGPWVPTAWGPGGQSGIHVALERTRGKGAPQSWPPQTALSKARSWICHKDPSGGKCCCQSAPPPTDPGPGDQAALPPGCCRLRAPVPGDREMAGGDLSGLDEAQRGSWCDRQQALCLDGRQMGSRSLGLATCIWLPVTSSSLACPAAPVNMPLLPCRFPKGAGSPGWTRPLSARGGQGGRCWSAGSRPRRRACGRR